MIKKNLLWSLGLLIVVALVGALPSTTQAQQDVSENFIFINYIGQELVLDLDDVTYIVPGTDTMPEGGQLRLRLAEAEHKYAANVPGTGLGSAGEFTIWPGGFAAKGAELRKSAPVVDHSGILLAGPQDEVFVFDFDPFAAPIEEAPAVDAWQPAAATPGMGSIVWINYGGDDELTVDLAGQLYKIPPKANDIPGRLQIEVSPGFYRYTASVPNGSLNGEIMLVAGQVASLNIIPGLGEEPEYDVGEKFDPLPEVNLEVVEEDLTPRAGQSDSAPAGLPATGGEIVPARPEITAESGNLLIKNYAGESLIFTINGQSYTIAQNAEQWLTLPPGRYTYTASLPFVAATGAVDLGTGQGVELSIAINIDHNILSVYQN